MGSPFGPSQLLRWVSLPSSPGLFWIFVHWYHVRYLSLSVSPPLLFWPSASFFSSSRVLYFALWLLLRVCDVVHCPPLWGSSSAFVYLALLLVACCAFYIRLRALLLVSYGFLCGFLFILTHFLPFLCSYVVRLFRSLCFGLGVGASGVWFPHLLLFIFICRHHCCACAAV